jgi:MSHA biogenesis protein MshJ
MITQKAKELMHRVDALTLRERLLVLAATLMITGGAWEAFLAAPLEAREQAASRSIETTRGRLDQLDTAMAVAAERIGGGITDQFDRVEALRREVIAGAESMRVLTSDLIDPAQMRFVLEDLIRRQGKLELVRASNLPVRRLLEPDPPAGPTDDSDATALYRHGLVLELEGSYLDLLDYLETVEQLPWQIHWTKLRLEADEHPRNHITLELATLSLDEDWIGV